MCFSPTIVTQAPYAAQFFDFSPVYWPFDNEFSFHCNIFSSSPSENISEFCKRPKTLPVKCFRWRSLTCFIHAFHIIACFLWSFCATQQLLFVCELLLFSLSQPTFCKPRQRHDFHHGDNLFQSGGSACFHILDQPN